MLTDLILKARRSRISRSIYVLHLPLLFSDFWWTYAEVCLFYTGGCSHLYQHVKLLFCQDSWKLNWVKFKLDDIILSVDAKSVHFNSCILVDVLLLFLLGTFFFFFCQKWKGADSLQKITGKCSHLVKQSIIHFSQIEKWRFFLYQEI